MREDDFYNQEFFEGDYAVSVLPEIENVEDFYLQDFFL